MTPTAISGDDASSRRIKDDDWVAKDVVLPKETFSPSGLQVRCWRGKNRGRVGRRAEGGAASAGLLALALGVGESGRTGLLKSAVNRTVVFTGRDGEWANGNNGERNGWRKYPAGG